MQWRDAWASMRSFAAKVAPALSGGSECSFQMESLPPQCGVIQPSLWRVVCRWVLRVLVVLVQGGALTLT